MRVPALTLCIQSLRTSTRSSAHHLARTLLVTALMVVLICLQETLSWSAPGRTLLWLMSMVNFLAISVLGLSAFSGVIAEEKEQMTLGLLKLAGFNPLSILLGKSLGLLVMGLLLILVQLPFLLLSITLGGVVLGQVVAAYVSLLAYAFCVYGISLLCSVLCATPGRAARWTALLLGLFLCSPDLAAFVAARAGSWGPGLSDLTGFLTEASIVRVVFGASMTGFDPHSIWAAIGLNVGVAMTFSMLAWLAFERLTRNERPPGTTRGLAQRLDRFFLRGGSERVTVDPLLWKDYRFMRGGFTYLVLRFFLAFAVAGAALYFGSFTTAGTVNWHTYGGFLLGTGLWLLIIEAGVVAGRFLNQEVRWQTLPALVLLPISIRRLVSTKALAHSIHLLPTLMMIVVGIVIAVMTSPETQRIDNDSASVVVYFFGSIALTLHVITYASLFLRRGAFAIGVCVYLIGNFVLLITRFLHGGETAFWLGICGMLGTIGMQALIGRAVKRVAAR